MANEDIRNLINNRRLKYWEIAKEYGTTDSNFSRLLRTPLSDDNREKQALDLQWSAFFITFAPNKLMINNI